MCRAAEAAHLSGAVRSSVPARCLRDVLEESFDVLESIVFEKNGYISCFGKFLFIAFDLEFWGC